MDVWLLILVFLLFILRHTIFNSRLALNYDIMLIALMLFSILVSLKRLKISMRFVLWSALLSIVIIISFFSTTGHIIAFAERALLFITLLYFIVIIVNNCSKNLKKSLYFFAIVVLVLNIFLLIFATSISLKGNRLMGIFYNPNGLALTISLLIPIILAQKNEFIRTVLYILLAINLILSGSRNGFISLLISFPFFIFEGSSNKMVRIKKYRLIASIFFLVLLFITIKFKVNYHLSTVIFRIIDFSSNLGNRQEYFLYGYKDILKKPLFGNGYGSYDTLIINSNILRTSTFNTYIDVFRNIGTVGGGVFFYPLIKAFIDTIRQRRWNDFLGVLLVFQTGLFESYYIAPLGVATVLAWFWIFNAWDDIKGNNSHIQFSTVHDLTITTKDENELDVLA